MIKKHLQLVPILLLAFLLLTSKAFTEGLVTDETGYLTPQEIDTLSLMCKEIEDRYGFLVIIRVVNKTPGYTQSDSDAGYYGLRQYAADYYDARYPGKDGVIFAVRFSDRWYVSVTTGKGISILTTEKLDKCEDRVNPFLRAGRYYDAFRIYLQQIVSTLEMDSCVIPEMYPFTYFLDVNLDSEKLLPVVPDPME